MLPQADGHLAGIRTQANRSKHGSQETHHAESGLPQGSGDKPKSLLVTDFNVPESAVDPFGNGRKLGLNLFLLWCRLHHTLPLFVRNNLGVLLVGFFDLWKFPFFLHFDAEFLQMRKKFPPLVMSSQEDMCGSVRIIGRRASHGIGQEFGEVIY